jgi:hypothetical protein
MCACMLLTARTYYAAEYAAGHNKVMFGGDAECMVE